MAELVDVRSPPIDANLGLIIWDQQDSRANVAYDSLWRLFRVQNWETSGL